MELSNRIRLARPLPTAALHGRVEELKAKGQPILDLSIAFSNYPAPEAVIARTTERLRGAPLPYTSVIGAERLRTSLVKKINHENNIDARIDEVIVTNGAKQAIYEALYVLTDPGDEVIIFAPFWPAYIGMVELLGLRPILVDLPDQISASTLEALPPAKIVIFNSPHNPTGKVFSRAELSCIKNWISANRIYAICDESYEKLVFEGEHISLAALSDWRALGVITVFSASQSYAMMGWRVGFAVAPEAVVRAMEVLQGPITAATSALTQIAAEAAFSLGTPREMIEDYRIRRNIAVELFSAIPWITMHCPEGGPYIWCDISALTADSIGFAEGLLEHENIAVMPGDPFGTPGWIRLSFISDVADTLHKAAAGIIRFGENLCNAIALAKKSEH